MPQIRSARHPHAPDTAPDAEPPRLDVHRVHRRSLDNSPENHNSHTHSPRADGSITPLHELHEVGANSGPRSPLYPSTVILAQDRAAFHRPADANVTHNTEEPPCAGEGGNTAARQIVSVGDGSQELEDPASGALLIYPKKIDNLRRFRMLFVGLLVSISSSTQVMHSVFGVIYMQTVYLFDVREMTIVYLSGIAVGMFTFPFAVLYDWFGPRLPIAVASAIGAVGHLLFALTFAGHIPHTVAHCAVFYAIMCWGCYGLDVVVVPTVLTHMPRDRGVPVGMLQTFSTFGGSIFTCWFRGFFEGNYSNLMWFLFAVMVVVGVVGTWYLEDAPYVVNRWRRRRITPRQQLRAFLIRNRYMSQLVPQRRYTFMTMVLILMNVYLFIQGVCVGYLAADITPGKMRGIAIGAIVLFLLILILVVPVNAIDGLSEQDKEVIAAAREKEAALRAMQAERYHTANRLSNSAEVGEMRQGAATTDATESPMTRPAALEAGVNITSMRSSTMRAEEKKPRASSNEPAEADLDEARRSGGLSEVFGVPLHQRAMTTRSVIMVDVEEDGSGIVVDASPLEVGAEAPSSPFGAAPSTFTAVRQTTEPPAQNAAGPSAGAASSVARRESTYIFEMAGSAAHFSRARNPRVETINLCDEVYVVPVYNTTFLQSLMNLDIWLVFYTTLCVWGVGLTMLGSWNVQTMLKARYGGMEAKHYILVSGFCGMATAMGRVFLGIYERLLKVVRERTGVAIVPTLIYPIASLGLFLGMILWIALPGNMGLLAAYIVSAYFYGMNTSATFYVISTIFARDIGMHYGFCFLGAGIGFVLCYWCSWYLTYSHEATSGRCIGERRCMNRAVGIYLCLIFSSFSSSFHVHRRYFSVVNRNMRLHDVIAARMRGLFYCCCGCRLSRRDGADGRQSSDELE